MIADTPDQIRRAERQRIHDRIIAELVCCDLYLVMNNARPEDLGMTEEQAIQVHPRDLAKLLGYDYHSICHWGGYAAQIALDDPDEH